MIFLEDVSAMDRHGKPQQGWLRSCFVREDATYDHYAAVGQARSSTAKLFYLFMYLLPGMVAFVVINVGWVYRMELRATGMTGKNLQYGWLLILTFGWHMVAPMLFLRFADRLSFKQSLEFLGLNRIDLRGVFFVLPVYCVAFAVVALAYMRLVWNPLEAWLQSIPLFRVPAYSIFQPGPNGLYSFSPIALVFLFVGNFLGEELYYRGYLMKKSAFLGSAVWVVNPLLFALYHLWQVPQTWPLVGLVLTMGLLMRLRKDLYVLIGFHFFINMWLAFGAYPLEKFLHLSK